MKCVICGKEFDEVRRGFKDTCSSECGFKKSMAWSLYISRHKNEIMKKAIEEYKREYGY